MGGIPLPTALSTPASQWVLQDFIDRDWSSTPATGGAAVLTLEQIPDDLMWLVDQMVCSCDSSTTTTMRLYLDQRTPRRIRDGSNSGNFDVGGWSNGLLIPARSTLIAVWSGASNGAVGTLGLQARVFRRT
jgi:hypothetical protein